MTAPSEVNGGRVNGLCRQETFTTEDTEDTEDTEFN